MYEPFYGLNSRPFELTPDPRFLYLTPTHREALAHLEYGLSGRKGITVLVGEVGTGKTTLVHAALDRARSTNVRCAQLSNPTLTRNEFYELLAAEFGLSDEAGQSKAQFLIELKELVVKQHQSGAVTALIVDEAHRLSTELLEEIRLLANFESNTDKLLQVVLIGQPELADRLNEPDLRQIKQRVALRCSLQAMTLGETAAYIAGRIRIAGGDAARLFSREAVAEIHERTRGIPRLVSVVCDNSLVNGFAAGVRPVGRQIVLDVCRDFDFRSRHSGGTGANTPPSGGGELPAPDASHPKTEKPSSATAGSSAADAPEPRRFSFFGTRRGRS
jgi:general secretion pathway protein A